MYFMFMYLCFYSIFYFDFYFYFHNVFTFKASMELERIKNADPFWSTWATSDDFAKYAKKRWDQTFLKAMTSKL